MRKFLLAVALVMTLAVIAVAYVSLRGPDARELRSLEIDATPARLERGAYLSRHVLGCAHCHTQRDPDRFDLPAVGPEYAGGECLDEAINFPGVVCAQNITRDAETGVGTWTDDELLRAVREGVSRDGRALFPLMPYLSYRALSDEDAYAVIAHIRNAPAQRNEMPATRLEFPVNLYVNQLPQPLEEPQLAPPPADPAYGEYLATVASCRGCHGEDLAGGEEFPTLKGVVRAPNITPHETGLLPDELAGFKRLFRRFSPENEGNEDVEDGLFTVMPWRAYSGMKDSDLEALYGFLSGVAPADNQVRIYGQSDD